MTAPYRAPARALALVALVLSACVAGLDLQRKENGEILLEPLVGTRLTAANGRWASAVVGIGHLVAAAPEAGAPPPPPPTDVPLFGHDAVIHSLGLRLHPRLKDRPSRTKRTPNPRTQFHTIRRRAGLSCERLPQNSTPKVQRV